MWRNITSIRFHARKIAEDMLKYLVTLTLIWRSILGQGAAQCTVIEKDLRFLPSLHLLRLFVQVCTKVGKVA